MMTDIDGDNPDTPAAVDAAAIDAGGAAGGGAHDGAAAVPGEPGDDPRLPDSIEQIALDTAISDARRPLADPTKELWSTDPDKAQARAAIEKTYKAAMASSPEGALAQLYRRAQEEFIEAAKHLTRSESDGSTPLGTWLAAHLRSGTPLWSFLKQLPNLQNRVFSRKGWRERDRDALRETTARWVEAHRLWSDPVGSMTAMLTGLSDKIETAHGQFGDKDNGDLAVYRFWFEYAPIVLQLSPALPTDTTVPGYDAVKGKFNGFAHLLERLKSGEERKDGSLYLIAGDLTTHRQWILGEWRKSADKLAASEAHFNLRPDDLATLAPRLKERIDREADLAKDAFPAPATP